MGGGCEEGEVAVEEDCVEDALVAGKERRGSVSMMLREERLSSWW